MNSNSRSRLLATLSMSDPVSPPRYENEFSDEVVAIWRDQGVLANRTVEDRFGLDRRETVPVNWSQIGRRTVVETENDLDEFAQRYDASARDRIPKDWEHTVASWHERDYALLAAPWSEGLFQVMGVSDGATLCRAMVVLRERPQLVKALMEHYAAFLETLIPRVLASVEIDYALFYEPIAWTHAPVISPDDYARFAFPALKRVVNVLADNGVQYRVVRATGEVRPMIPLWLDAGINGLMITQTAATGIQYPALRQEYGPDLRLFGGIDSLAVINGPTAIDRALEETAKPLLDDGGYIAHLDDTVRANCPFEHFRYYRERLDTLL